METCAGICGRTDGRADVKKITGTFRDNANTPKKRRHGSEYGRYFHKQINKSFHVNYSNVFHILGAFVKFRNATISYVMSLCLSACPSVRPSVCLSVRPFGITRLPLHGFLWKFIFEYFSKSLDKIQGPLKSSFNRRPKHICANISLKSS
jgi:hypothetical protein